MAGFRLDKINEQIKAELYIIIKAINDPRVPKFFSVTEVNITPDLKYGKVFLSFLEGNEKEIMAGLKSASGYIKRELGHRLSLRAIPDLTYIIDHSIENGARISKVLSQYKKVETEGKEND